MTTRSTKMDQELAREIAASQNDTSFSTVLSGTMCIDDFYEGNLLHDFFYVVVL